MTDRDETRQDDGGGTDVSGTETDAAGRPLDESATAETSGPRGGESRRWRGRFLTGLQWTVALGAFAYVARGVDWRATGAELTALPTWVIVAVLAVTVLEFGSRFGMWYALLGARGSVSIVTCARIDLTIKFVNHVLPSKASGHSVAPLVLRHYAALEWSEAVSLSGLNTALYACLYGAVALVGIAAFALRLPGGVLAVVALSTGLYLAAGALVLLAGRNMAVAGRLVGRLSGVLSRVPRVGERLAGVAGAVPSFTDDSAATFRELSTNPSVVVPYALGWAGTLMIAPGLRVGLLLAELGGGFAPLFLLPVALVLAYSVTILPLTPGGVGVAEASATLVLTALGVAPELAAAVVLVDRTLGVYLPALLGWIPAATLDVGAVLAGDD